MIKDQMDKKFGAPWHVIVGRAFAYEITYEVRMQLHGRLQLCHGHAA
jgi:dynein light chain 4